MLDMMLDEPHLEIAQGPIEPQELRQLELTDLGDALRFGWNDFAAYPSFAVMIALIYPVLGLVMARILHSYSFLPLLFPLAAGFGLLGPFVAVLFYDISRRRERGDLDGWISVASLSEGPSRGSTVLLGAILAVLFFVWIGIAQAIYNAFYGFAPVASMADFVVQVATTSKGLRFLFSMCGTGFAFALVAFCLSVVSFPLLLDRRASPTDAMLTSFRVIAKSPRTLAAWGLTIAALLLVGIAPAFLGLAVVIPVLGHATWHLYRRAVIEPDSV